MNRNPVLLTRVCLDDFDIFKIWILYYKRRYSDIRVCIFKRQEEEITDIENFCRQEAVRFELLERETFDNEPTYEVLARLSSDASGQVCFLADCDEFVSNFDELDRLVSNMPADSILLKMVDRISYDIFYDISRCETYEDLCAVAPISGTLTKDIQNWSDERCCLNILPDTGRIHYPSPGKSSVMSTAVHLDHFKWRTAWLDKAKRRLHEVRSIGYEWQHGLAVMLDILGDEKKPRKYLTIPGFCDYENIYAEQCNALSDGATLVELGIWKGRSIAYLAEYSKILGKRFNLFGVDTFGGVLAGEHIWADYSLHETKENLEWRGLGGMIKFLQMTTAEAALYFPDNSVDFLWIDGTHSLKSVMKNIVAWWPKIKVGGTIGGHDLVLGGVAEALDRLNISYEQAGSSWIVRNMSTDRPLLSLPMP